MIVFSEPAFVLVQNNYFYPLIVGLEKKNRLIAEIILTFFLDLLFEKRASENHLISINIF